MSEEQKRKEIDYIKSRAMLELKKAKTDKVKSEDSSRTDKDMLEGIKSDNLSYAGRGASPQSENKMKGKVQ